MAMLSPSAEPSEDTLPAPDLSLIRHFTPALEQAGPYYPSITHFQKGAKELYYLGAHHAPGIDNLTQESARQAIENYKPDLVIVEGVETRQGLSPEQMLKNSRYAAMEGFAHSEEPNFAAYHANKNGIPFLGGEPSAAEVYQAMKAQGYSAKDTMADWLLRLIPIARRTGQKMDAAGFDAWANRVINSPTDPYFSQVPKEERLTLPEFKAWYEAHKRPGENFLTVTERDTNPHDAPDASYFQKLTKVMDDVREKHLDTVIGEALANHNRVLVVYGSAHAKKSMPVFEAMFGSKGETYALTLPPALSKNSFGNVPLPEASIVSSAETDGLAKGLSYAGLALAALSVAVTVAASIAAGTLAFPALAGGLLLAGAVSLGGSVIAEEMQPAASARQPTKQVETVASGALVPAYALAAPTVEQARSDTKSWVQAVAAQAQDAVHRGMTH